MREKPLPRRPARPAARWYERFLDALRGRLAAPDHDPPQFEAVAVRPAPRAAHVVRRTPWGDEYRL